MTMLGIIDAIRAAVLERESGRLELYRKEVRVAMGEADPVQISLLEMGPERPEATLVLVHGLSASSAWWRSQMEPLALRNRVIAVDLRGHGQSSRTQNGYTIRQMADDIAGVLDVLEVDGPVILAGHSVGGFVVTEFALRYPRRVSKLILVATPVSIRIGSLPLPARLAIHLPDWMMRLIQPVYELDPQGRGTADLRGLKRLFHQDISKWNGAQKFPHLTQPALVIVGDRDYAFPQESYTQVAQLIPHSELVNVGVSKHQVLLERPKAVVRAIQRFIEPGDAARFQPRWRSENDAVDSIRLLAERPWVARYEKYVPQVLHVPQLPVTRLLETTARRFPRKVAIRYGAQRILYETLWSEASRFAAALHFLGVKPGERVLLLLPNRPHFVIALYGALRLGAVVVLSHPGQESDAICLQAQRTGAKVLVTLGDLDDLARSVRAESAVEHLIFTTENDYDAQRFAGRGVAREEDDLPQESVRRPVADPRWDPQCDHLWSELVAGEAANGAEESPAFVAQPGDTALVVFTRSSGALQGVRLSHRNLTVNALQMSVWLPETLTGQERFLCAVPFSHIYGVTLGINLPVHRAGTLILLPDFELHTVLESFRKYRPSVFLASPVLYMALDHVPGVRRFISGAARNAIRVCISGSAPLPVEVKEAFERLTRARLIEGYGLSEASPMTHANPLVEDRTGSIGLPLPETEANIVDLESGRSLPPGEIGELLVRGPQVMQGYWEDEESTRAILDVDGWLHTGDLARMDDDGYFQLLGPKQDLWRMPDGAPAFPRDVEEVLYELPGVGEVSVVAVENRPVAFLARHPQKELTGEQVLDFCRRRLPPTHVPAQVLFLDRLPRTVTGKVIRGELIRRYAEEFP